MCKEDNIARLGYIDILRKSEIIVMLTAVRGG